MKKIAMLTCGSNFERQHEYVIDTLREIRNQGDSVFYVLTCYDAITSTDMPINDQSIYYLAEKSNFDGYFVDANLNFEFVQDYIAKNPVITSKPLITIGLDTDKYPCIFMDGYDVTVDIMEHLIVKHGCKKINFVLNALTAERQLTTQGVIKAYKDTLKKHGIPYEEKRIIHEVVGIPESVALWDQFVKSGVDDCDAVLCNHDIYAIGLMMRLQQEGIKVPDQVKLVSTRRSSNSVAFRPDISGVVTNESDEAKTMLNVLNKMIARKPVEQYNLFKGLAVFGESCGCSGNFRKLDMDRCQDIVLNKINAATQIKAMMRYNDAMEKVTTLDEFAAVIKMMFSTLGFTKYALCLNKRDLPYILDEGNVDQDRFHPFDDKMYALIGSDGESEIKDLEFSIKKVIPFETHEGDIVTIMPIMHKNRAFGYFAIVNNTLPYEQYNFRICYETLGSSIENLRKQMILKHNYDALNELRMTDPMTGLYNRQSISYFKTKYINGETFTVTMLDMDGLKYINDTFGHLAGNHAISLFADAIKKVAAKGELVVRYGGDEFVVVSHGDDTEFWINQRKELNALINKQVTREKLPYSIGVSIGTSSTRGTEEKDFYSCLSAADECMYANKAERKTGRK